MTSAGKHLTPDEVAAFREKVQVELLQEKHQGAIADFTCHLEIDKFLKKDALRAGVEGFSVTWVFVHEGHIVGYVSLANSAVLMADEERTELTINQEWKLWPALLIGYLGVDKRYQGGGRGLGDFLINYAVGEAELLAERSGCKFVVADVYDDEYAIAMYERNGFKRGRHKKYEDQKRPKYWRVLTSNPAIKDMDAG